MSDEQKQSTFEGWALVEMMGHQREVGYVTTEYFGGAAMFRIEVPSIAERELTNEGTEEKFFPDFGYLKPGQVATSAAVPARTRLVAPGSLYALNPCTEEAAKKTAEQMMRPAFRRVGEAVALIEGDRETDPDLDDDEDDEGFL